MSRIIKYEHISHSSQCQWRLENTLMEIKKHIMLYEWVKVEQFVIFILSFCLGGEEVLHPFSIGGLDFPWICEGRVNIFGPGPSSPEFWVRHFAGLLTN